MTSTRPSRLASTGQSIAWYARHAPATIAITGDGPDITYQRLAVDLIHCVRALRSTASRPGAVIGLHTSQRYWDLLLLLACEVTGLVGTSLVADDLPDGDAIVPHCDLIFSDSLAASAGPPRIVSLSPEWLAKFRGSPVSVDELRLLEHDIPPDQVVRIVRTSGTTGRRKAMPMTHKTQQRRVITTIARVAHDILPNPRFLCLYGLAVGSVYVRVLGVLRYGGTVFMTTGPQVDSLIAAGAVNYAIFSLGDIERTVRRAVPVPGRHKWHVEVFGATASSGLRRQIRERLNAHITNKYSSNETNPIAVIGDDNVGTLYPGVEVRIVDESGGDKPAGEPGIIRVRTETMVHGYFNDPALTEASFIDGWFQTRDIGFMPEPGKLVLLGRADDMLNIGGLKIPPSPVEERLKSIGGVNDAIVMSIANENDVSFMLVAAETGGEVSPDELTRQIGAVAAEYTLGFRVMLMPRFPRTETGKVKRHEIEAAFLQGAAG